MVPGFKPFEEMTAEDYAAVGFMSGLEVHQQLLTDTKLFCRCPAGRFSDAYDAEILRHMRPTLSELGEYDGTALMEKKTRKNIFYRIHHDTVCTYEFDDTPPFLISDQALDIAIEISLLLRLNLVGEVHIARKQYLDGSIPTGFQRTGIIGVSGWIPYGDRKIGIRQLSIEEDSCREVSDIGHERVYLTDRLGMPLVEAVTEPEMYTPQQVADVCEIIRRLYRSTKHVRTGYGATREDVNVSVRGGTRIEIKGVPQISRIPRLVYNEAMRQWSLLLIRDELQNRGVTPETFTYSTHDITRHVSKTRYAPIQLALSKGLLVKAVVLPGFSGLLNRQTQENTTFSTEFSDRVRVIACLTHLPNIVHSDTAAETLSARDWQQLRRRVKAGTGDALVLVWGDERDTHTACEEIAIRAREATQGIPSDTRQAHKDGTTGFERVLPGPERMYPDTDLPPIAITAERIERITAALPRDVWEFEKIMRQAGVPESLVGKLCVSPRAELFEPAVNELKLRGAFVARVLHDVITRLSRAGLPVDNISHDELFEILRAVADERLAPEAVDFVLEELLQVQIEYADATAAEKISHALQRLEFVPLPDDAVDQHVAAVVADAAARSFESEHDRLNYCMGTLMTHLLGRVSGRRLAERVRAQLPAFEPATA